MAPTSAFYLLKAPTSIFIQYLKQAFKHRIWKTCLRDNVLLLLHFSVFRSVQLLWLLTIDCNNYHEISLTPLVARPELGREAITRWGLMESRTWHRRRAAAANSIQRYKSCSLSWQLWKNISYNTSAGREKMPARSAAYSNSWIWRLFLQRNLESTIQSCGWRGIVTPH